MNIVVVAVVIFIMAIFVIELCFHAYRTFRNPNRGKIRKRLRYFAHREYGNESTDIMRKRVLSDIPWLNSFLLSLPGIERLERLMQQANAPYPLGFFILLSLVLAICGFLGSSFKISNSAVCLLIGVMSGGTPFLYLKLKKQERIEKFQKQLPEGLELIARALKAGHAFTNGMKLASDEFDDPLGPEFEDTLEAINFGVSVSDALKNLAGRIDCPELKFFVVSVILQRETGGNLAEIIEKLAHLIRERFKLEGKIRILAAEGKLSAIVLVVLPFLFALYLRISNPKYLETLFSVPVGRIMVGAAVINMLIGIIVIKKMIAIRV